MAYSNLDVLPVIQSIAEDGSQFTIEDQTVYNPVGGDPLYPSFAETKRFFFFQKVPFLDPDNLDEPFLPLTQPQADPFLSTRSLLDNLGVPFTDEVYRGVLFVVPLATDLDALRDGIIQDGIDFWLEYAAQNWALGVLTIFVNTTSSACLNDSMMRLNDVWPGECSQEEYKSKFVFFQGVVYQGVLAEPMPIPSDEQDAEYAVARATLDVMLSVCADPNNCTC